ncbi:hypothetical protein ACFL4W_05460, partial [Planctomycetota bacterium]
MTDQITPARCSHCQDPPQSVIRGILDSEGTENRSFYRLCRNCHGRLEEYMAAVRNLQEFVDTKGSEWEA